MSTKKMRRICGALLQMLKLETITCAKPPVRSVTARKPSGSEYAARRFKQTARGRRSAATGATYMSVSGNRQSHALASHAQGANHNIAQANSTGIAAVRMPARV